MAKLFWILRIGGLVALSLLANRVMTGAEAYAIRFSLVTFPNGDCLAGILWHDDILFHNTTTGDLRVRLLGISNGTTPQPPSDLLVPAGRTASATGNTNWDAVNEAGLGPIWVVHLDVPAGIVFQSRADGYTVLCGSGLPPSPFPDRGSFSLPVARNLTPARTSRTFLGTDFGFDPSHTNVGVYNGGSVAAQAIIETRQGCDDAVLDRRTVGVPPNTVVQISGIGSETSCRATNALTSPWTRYIVVTVDQPSFSYVIKRLEDLKNAEKIPYGAPITQE